MADIQPITEAQQRFRTTLCRQLLGAAMVVAAVSALLFVLFPGPLGLPARLGMCAGDLALAFACHALRRDGTPAQLESGLPLVVAVALALTGVASWATGEGLYSPGLAFFGVLLCLLTAVCGLRRGAQAAALALAILVVFALAGALGWIPDPIAAHAPVARLFVTHIMVLAVALSCGGLLGKVLDQTLRNTDERERRFTGLLAIAADAYWELDGDGRLMRFSAKDELRAFVGLRAAGTEGGLGQLLWETRGVRFDPQVLETFKSELVARLPMRDVPLRWSDSAGRERHFTLSAEPRVTGVGKFGGYWGVLRDVTPDVKARQALWATETRYQDLFRRIPTPLVLHRETRVLDANPAAVALFGFPDLRSMLGKDMVSVFEAGPSRERALLRVHELEALTIGQGLADAEFTISPQAGRLLTIRMSSVRVDVDGEAATLSIISDDTERKSAEDMIRRSEALLSHLVSTSPDAIVLNEMPSGRYTMVNPTFLALTGYHMDEIIGRTSTELGLWPDTGQRDRFFRMMDEHRKVQNLPAELAMRDGRHAQFLLSAARFTIDGHEYQMTSARDVTAVEQTRREREAILENALIGIAITRDRQFQMTNPRFDAMFGWEREALTGQPGHVVWPSPEAHAEIGQRVGPALARGEQVDVEGQMMRRDGSTFTCRLLAKALDPNQPGRGGTLWLAEDVTDRRAVEQALARARDEAEAANRAKSAFLANTSHEIRTPLNALLGLAQLARTPEVDDARRSQYLEQICESAETLSAILSDILDLSKIEAGKLIVEHVGFDLRSLCNSLTQAWGALADTKGLTMRLDFEPDVPEFVTGDPVRLRQILSNYLTNALKFTTRGSIGLNVQRGVGHRIRFEVIDTGAGMDTAGLAMLFQPFSQVDNSITRKVGGTGLGLSICAELARLMGGEVGVLSEPGHGSLFWCEVPLAASTHDDARSHVSSHGDDVLQGTRVLMVEDNAVNMMIAVALLERWGAIVDQADDGPGALQAVHEAAASGNPFDVVLMDVQMPGMSGHEVTRRLRRLYDARELPIIALTAAALVSERADALAAGMNEFLTKPIDAHRLRLTLQRVLKAREEG